MSESQDRADQAAARAAKRARQIQMVKEMHNKGYSNVQIAHSMGMNESRVRIFLQS